MVNYYLKVGRGIIDAKKIALAESKVANTASCKRKYNNVKNGKATPSHTDINVPKADKATNEKETEDNKTAASNSSDPQRHLPVQDLFQPFIISNIRC